jgi:hypothetical protein
VTTTSDPDTDVDVGELIGTDNEDGLVELRPEDLGGEQLERLAVDLDQALALHTARDGCDTRQSPIERFASFETEIRTRGILLLAEHLNCLGGRHFDLMARYLPAC